MDTRPAYAGANLTIAEFISEHALRGGRLELLVLEDGRLAGIVTASAARGVPQERWATTPIARILSRAVPTLKSDAKVSTILQMLSTTPFMQIPVVQDGRVVGMFGRNDIARYRWLRGRLQLQLGAAPPYVKPEPRSKVGARGG